MNALISPSDKTGLDQLALGLKRLGYTLLATDGTKAYLQSIGVDATSVSDLTGFPEMLGGRVKTLHPMVHAGLLARASDSRDLAELSRFGIEPISLLVVNLYPFRETVEKPEVSFDEVIEQIDVGGVAMLRAGAKNFQSVLTLVDPSDYDDALAALSRGEPTMAMKRAMAAKSFQHVAAYDSHVAGFLRDKDLLFPNELTVSLSKVADLRYGENPHQNAALYLQVPNPRAEASIAGAEQLNGKALSFNNLQDVDAAWSCVRDFSHPCVAIIKHSNPCGLACADDLPAAYHKAYDGDPVSAFGGAIGLNREVDEETAAAIARLFYEDIIAPSYSPEALAILCKKKNLRVLAIDPNTLSEDERHMAPTGALDFRRIDGGFLVQTQDTASATEIAYTVASDRAPTLEELTDLEFAWRTVKYVKSNAIVLAKGLSVVGVGAGQMSRVDAVDLATRKAGERSVGAVLASDAFFPMTDGVEHAASAGVTAIIQPGGSIRDKEVISAANQRQMAMLLTGERHFRH